MAFREGLHAFQSGKKLRPIIQQYFTILFPPRTLHAPATRPGRCHLEEVTTSTWGRITAATPRPRLPDDTPHPLQVAPSSAPIAAPTPTPREEIEEQPTSLQPKRKRLDYKNGKGLAKDATKPVVTLISESWTQVDVTFTGDTVRTKGTLIPDNEVMVYPEIPDVAHKFAARLKFGTTFEVMEFFCRTTNRVVLVHGRRTRRNADDIACAGRHRGMRG